MRKLLAAALMIGAGALTQPAHAENETVVPVEKAPYHRPVFHNDLVLLLSVYLPPGAPRGPEVYHTHSLDQVSVLASAADMTNQPLGGKMGEPRHGTTGNAGYTAFSKKPENPPRRQCRRDAVPQSRRRDPLPNTRPLHRRLARRCRGLSATSRQ